MRNRFPRASSGAQLLPSWAPESIPTNAARLLFFVGRHRTVASICFNEIAAAFATWHRIGVSTGQRLMQLHLHQSRKHFFVCHFCLEKKDIRITHKKKHWTKNKWATGLKFVFTIEYVIYYNAQLVSHLVQFKISTKNQLPDFCGTDSIWIILHKLISRG